MTELGELVTRIGQLVEQSNSTAGKIGEMTSDIVWIKDSLTAVKKTLQGNGKTGLQDKVEVLEDQINEQKNVLCAHINEHTENLNENRGKKEEKKNFWKEIVLLLIGSIITILASAAKIYFSGEIK